MLLRRVKDAVKILLFGSSEVIKSSTKKPGSGYYQNSFSQSGEDLIIKFILEQLKIDKPTYLDIGGHHAWHLSNTALFYLKDARGVLIEPDPELISKMKIARCEDICLNVGIGIGKEEKADFFIMSTRTLNTFSKEEAERYSQLENHKIEKVLEIPLVDINKIIEQYFPSPPDFISLDTEGFDLAILETLDFAKHRPKVFCIETITYTTDNSEKKINSIIDFMCSKNYMVYADTYINTIFVDTTSWKSR